MLTQGKISASKVILKRTSKLQYNNTFEAFECNRAGHNRYKPKYNINQGSDVFFRKANIQIFDNIR